MKILANLWAGVSANAAQFGVYALLAAAIFMGGYFKGSGVERVACADKERDVALAYAGEIVEGVKRAEALEAENNRLRADQAQKARIITKEVIRYATLAPADRCTLPGLFRLLHDAAATGTPAEAGPLADGSAGAVEAAPVDDAAVLETVADNYRACRETALKLEGWQRRQRALDGASP